VLAVGWQWEALVSRSRARSGYEGARLGLVVVTAGAIGLALAMPAGASPSSGGAGPDVIRVQKFSTVDVTGLPGVGQAPGGQGPTRIDLTDEFKKKKRLGANPLRRSPGSGDSVGVAPGAGSPTSSGRRAKSNPAVVYSFEGVSHQDSRLASDGNQFSGEPADQGLCAGNGYLLETVNSALRIFNSTTGAPVSQVVGLNEFYGFPPAINRTTGEYGPFTFDISCHYDPDSNRWYHLAVDLDQDPVTGDFTGKNYLDLAVSTTGDPTGAWNVYRIPGMNDGTEGTPNHGCAGGPCFADFPHIGADRNGIYITTNEFPFFGDGFTGAQVYAISKAALAAGAGSIDALLYDTSQPQWQVGPDQPGFTLWPALPAGSTFDGAQGGTTHFVSSNAVFDDASSDSTELIVWGLTNTKALRTGSAPKLTRAVVGSQRYAVPPPSAQKDGVAPLRDCLNDADGSVEGFNCGEALFELPPQSETTGPLDTSDSRVLDARYANGKLWAVLGTAAQVEGTQRAGVAWFVLNPSANSTGVRASLRRQGILALSSENLAYPTIAVTKSGRGVIGFTAVGENRHPSYAFASLDDVAGVGPVTTLREGQGVQDGFTEYPSIGGNRPRWGDYGAAAVDGSTVYISGQYIAQPGCSIDSFVFTGCDGTRTIFANWSTAVGALKP
jgi:hypothetical protein